VPLEAGGPVAHFASGRFDQGLGDFPRFVEAKLADLRPIADPDEGLLRGLKQSAHPASVACLAIDVGSQTGKAAARGGVALVLRERLRQFLLSRL
jgi:hypothetical protein